MSKKLLVVGAVVLALIAGAGAALAAAADNAVGPNAAYCGVGVGRMLGGQNPMTEVQEATGLSWEEVRSARLEGKSLADMLEENGKDVKTFVEQAVASHKVQVDELVAAGKITADQASLVMKNFAANIESNLNSDATAPNGRGCGFGQGGFGQGGRGMGGGRWQNQNTQPRGPAIR